MAVLRAESIWEVPVLGRFLAASAGRRNAASRDGDAEGAEAGRQRSAIGEPGERAESAPAPADEVAVRR